MRSALVLLFCAACSRAPAPDVVFVCEHGAAKSVIAATYFNQLAAAKGLATRAVARGATPQEALSTAAVAGLGKDGLAPALATPLPLSADDVRRSARVVTFDCDQPVMKGLAAMGPCWSDVPAPKDDYPRAREAIRAHVAQLVEELSRR